MYRFKHGRFAGMRMEQVFLRDAPALYEPVAWAEREDFLPDMVEEFNRLRRLLCRATISERCYQKRCHHRATSMTLPMEYPGSLVPSPYYWCDEHSPSEETEGISQMLAIDFDQIRQFGDKRSQQVMFRQIREALGISSGARITERFAKRFFRRLAE